MTGLTQMYLNNNKLNGSIPGTLGFLTKLGLMYLDDNEFIGADAAICGIAHNNFKYGCTFGSNQPDWKDGKLCPECLNSIASCGPPPVHCYSDGPAPTPHPTPHPTVPTPKPTKLQQLADDPDWRACARSGGFKCKDSNGNLGRSLFKPGFPGMQLGGTIPAEDLAMMTGLTSIDLAGNALTGLIPSTIGLLTNLNSLLLQSNRFTGAGDGICDILKDPWGLSFYGCDIGNQRGWNNGAKCPICLNEHPRHVKHTCSPPQGITCERTSSPTPAPTPSPTDQYLGKIDLTTVETGLCFGNTSVMAPHCWEFMLALWIAVLAIVVGVLIYELVGIPLCACRESHVRGIACSAALRHACRTKQLWSLCCSKRVAVPLVDGAGNKVGWFEWAKARTAYSTLSPMNRVLYEGTDNTSALLTDAVWQPTAVDEDGAYTKMAQDERL